MLQNLNIEAGTKTLDLSNQSLTTLELDPSHFETLERLSLQRNALTTLPREVMDLPNLKVLDISGNQIRSLPPLDQFQALEVLYAQDNAISNIQILGEQDSIKKLYLNNNPNLEALPEKIGLLRCLEDLQLNGTGIHSLPHSIGQLSNLDKLYIEGNELTSLPESIGKLKNLTRLNLDKNPLASLPETIGTLSSLHRLHLRHNNLSSLPSSLANLKSMVRLEFENTACTELPSPLQHLAENTQAEVLTDLLHHQTIDDEWRWSTKDLPVWRSSPTFLSTVETILSIGLCIFLFTQFPLFIFFSLFLTPLLLMRTESSVRYALNWFRNTPLKRSYRVRGGSLGTRLAWWSPFMALAVKVTTSVIYFLKPHSWLAIPGNYRKLAIMTDSFRPPELVPGSEVGNIYSERVVVMSDFSDQTTLIKILGYGTLSMTVLYRFLLKGGFIVFHWPILFCVLYPSFESLKINNKVNISTLRASLAESRVVVGKKIYQLPVLVLMFYIAFNSSELAYTQFITTAAELDVKSALNFASYAPYWPSVFLLVLASCHSYVRIVLDELVETEERNASVEPRMERYYYLTSGSAIFLAIALLGIWMHWLFDTWPILSELILKT